jgi:hypothetical protein
VTDPVAPDAAANAYLQELHALAPDNRRVVDKMPGNYRYVWLIALLFPKARIIHCVRDPRDIGLSIFTFRFHGEHGYAHDLADLGWTIAEQLKSMEHWKQALPGAILTLPLTSWIEDFDGALARVLAHVGLLHNGLAPEISATGRAAQGADARGGGAYVRGTHFELGAEQIAEMRRTTEAQRIGDFRNGPIGVLRRRQEFMAKLQASQAHPFGRRHFRMAKQQVKVAQ